MSEDISVNLPEIVTHDDWLAARQKLLTKEKEITRKQDELSAERRRMPMVEIDKNYIFEGPNGEVSLLDLFKECRQLIVYHFMFDPTWDEGCEGCSMIVDSMGHLSHLYARGTSLVLVSQAPLSKIEPFKERMGWGIPWFSSFESEFNYDFEATSKDGAQLQHQGLSVFLRDGDRVFHTYSTYLRGLDTLFSPFNYLDLTPFGRQETWEKSPEGWPQSPPYEWWRLHDAYDYTEVPGSCCHSRSITRK
ncbi:Predicted dithiol-disulfide oxidoreductase, DUF899 family [Virgibacillus subterraneus]|uniref:Predicted dithiol-disulfide oxidoreductase, DUF899 family n=2 Tax=Virgibacillus TaxID=84406 RepID=A0A1H1EUU1_9BACI|nr:MULTISPECIES: DUF899 domain-containing protein [Virgibacillus]SDQ92358.1 Predicted dithiol-disulfide oxidoreductase, DUF899 family [Virgibacillus salinus]SEQ47974.1 Predicted dithiol-disulfide oxidoreductase, DUF899 family [Virgibacillus subterraneus]